MKLFICGHARHGKDTVAEILSELSGLSYTSSSMAALRLFLFQRLKELGFQYRTIEEAFEARHNEQVRKLWFDEISRYNQDDPCRLAEQIFAQCPIYVGIRSRRELLAAKEKWPDACAIWVDASKRVQASEAESSITITADDADLIIDNNSTLERLRDRVFRTYCMIIDGGLDIYQQTIKAVTEYPMELAVIHPAMCLSAAVGVVCRGSVEAIHAADVAPAANAIADASGICLQQLASICTDIGIPLSVVAKNNLRQIFEELAARNPGTEENKS